MYNHYHTEHAPGTFKEYLPVEVEQGNTTWGVFFELERKRIILTRFVNGILHLHEFDMSPPDLFAFLQQIMDNNGVCLILADFLDDGDYFKGASDQKDILVRELRFWGRM